MSSPMSLRSRRELADSIRERYAAANRQQKATILDEFTAATGYGRKHAIAVLRRPPASAEPTLQKRSGPASIRMTYARHS